MNMWRLLLMSMWSLSLAAQAGTLSTPPSNIHAVYLVSKAGIALAEIDEKYASHAGRYTLTSTARPLGLLALFRPGKIFIESNGTIGAQGLQPLTFSYRQEGSADKDSEAKFFWGEHKLSLSHGALRSQLDLPDDTQDRLSAMYQFMFLNLKAATNLDFHMTNGSKLDSYHYSITTGTPYYSPAGAFETLYLDSQAKPGETRTEVWLAKAKHQLPCKVIITDPEGGQLTQELRKLEIQP